MGRARQAAYRHAVVHSVAARGTPNVCTLRTLCCAGPSKKVVLVDAQGNEEEHVFDGKAKFERWTALHRQPIKLQLNSGAVKDVVFWEELADGGRYLTSATIEKQVSGCTAQLHRGCKVRQRHHHSHTCADDDAVTCMLCS